MAATAEYAHGGDMGSIHAAAHDLPHMNDDGDVLVDPRMGMSFYGIKTEKDAEDSPSQFMLTPRMFGSDLDSNPIDYLGELPDDSVLDPSEDNIEVGPATGAPMVSPPETDSHTSPSSQAPSSSSAKRLASKRQPAAPVPPKLKRPPRTTRGAVQQLKRSNGQAGAASASSSKSGSGGGASTNAVAATSKGDARRSRCLERNRVAASKCREKKKQWVQDLESAKAELEQQHASLQAECASLLDEATQIKNWLMEHATCGDANIDAWIGNEAMRFVQRSGSGAGPGASRHSSIGSLASLQSRNSESTSLSDASDEAHRLLTGDA